MSGTAQPRRDQDRGSVLPDVLRTRHYFTINVGAALLASGAKPARPHFGITVGKVPGGAAIGGRAAGTDETYKNVAVAFNANDKAYLVLNETVIVKHKRTAGSFSGALLTGGTATGTFTCKKERTALRCAARCARAHLSCALTAWRATRQPEGDDVNQFGTAPSGSSRCARHRSPSPVRANAM